jgi:hypothetical protein
MYKKSNSRVEGFVVASLYDALWMVDATRIAYSGKSKILRQIDTCGGPDLDVLERWSHGLYPTPFVCFCILTSYSYTTATMSEPQFFETITKVSYTMYFTRYTIPLARAEHAIRLGTLRSTDS